MIKADASALRAIKSFLAGRGFQGAIRVDLQFGGCCDPSLGLGLDSIRESDLLEELEGVTFAMAPDTYQLVGGVTISYVHGTDEKGFVLTYSNPISEWDGFTIGKIRI
jgi:Fe-S cluster assembly iron-binding protein IscA